MLLVWSETPTHPLPTGQGAARQLSPRPWALAWAVTGVPVLSGFLGEPRSYVLGTLCLTPSPGGLQTTPYLVSSLAMALAPFDPSWAPWGHPHLLACPLAVQPPLAAP